MLKDQTLKKTRTLLFPGRDILASDLDLRLLAPWALSGLLGRPHSGDKKFVRARGPQNWNPEVFEQTRCSRILHM